MPDAMIKIAQLPTTPPADADKHQLREETNALIKRLGELQDILAAERKHGVLVVFQGMDASGKDGATRNVFKECHPNGLKVVSYKKPTEEEFARDFLWRVHQHTPPKGMIHIFNRSHYEDVLIQRVHGWIDEKRVDRRYQSINALEELLTYDANTHIFKFFLHISHEQQAVELTQRLEEKEKFFKHNANDWNERKYWDKYMQCYEDMLNRCSLPWHVVPVDKRWYRDYVITKTLVEGLEKLPLAYPPLPEGTNQWLRTREK